MNLVSDESVVEMTYISYHVFFLSLMSYYA